MIIQEVYLLSQQNTQRIYFFDTLNQKELKHSLKKFRILNVTRNAFKDTKMYYSPI